MKDSLFIKLFVILPGLFILAGALAVYAGTCDEKADIYEDYVPQIPANAMNSRTLKLDVTSYAGFIKVPGRDKNGGYHSHMFYWFFESRNSKLAAEDSKKEIPLLIWINGGPGASSAAGLMQENGPVSLLAGDTGTVVNNPYGWNEKMHVIYWDNPVWAGYSYSVPKDHYADSEKELSRQFYHALQGFFKLHPEYRACPLYFAGESYGGKYVPHIATEILEGNEKNKGKPGLLIKLTGLVIADGWICPKVQLKKQIEYAYTMGFIDTLQREKVEKIYREFCKTQDAADRTPPGPEKDRLVKKAYCLGDMVMNVPAECGGGFNAYDVRLFEDLPPGDILNSYMNTCAVKKALHVPESHKWITADEAGPVNANLLADVYRDASYLYDPLLEKLRVLFYTGNFDQSCGFMGIEELLQNVFKYPGKIGWHKLKREVWVKPPSQTLGYVKYIEQGKVYKLLQVNIPGAGHMVPATQPEAARIMIDNFVFNLDFAAYDPLRCLNEQLEDCSKQEKGD